MMNSASSNVIDASDLEPRVPPSAACCRSILIVGANGWAADLKRDLASALPQVDVRAVDNYLMALGQIAGEAPGVLVGHIDELDSPAVATVTALRTLAPQTRLLLIAKADPQSAARQTTAAGFDQYLCEPVDINILTRIVADPQVTDDAAPIEPRPIPSRRADVELFDQLLSEHPQVTTVALQIMSDRTGLQPLGWCAAADEVPSGRSSVLVKYDDRELGYLYAPGSAAGAALEPWALWLGRWLALERRIAELRREALTDELTGLWNRRYFDQKLHELLTRAADERFSVTLMIFDIDHFKQYNDRYGHSAGDEILCECGKLMRAEVRVHDIVARIGGDEFGVIFWDADEPRRPNSQHPTNVRLAAERFQKAIAEHRFPKLARCARGTLTISGGLAGFPWDGRTPKELYERADAMAMQSKQNGKNILTFGPGAARNDAPESE